MDRKRREADQLLKDIDLGGIKSTVTCKLFTFQFSTSELNIQVPIWLYFQSVCLAVSPVCVSSRAIVPQ